jgi:hypothetical protein
MARWLAVNAENAWADSSAPANGIEEWREADQIVTQKRRAGVEASL